MKKAMLIISLVLFSWSVIGATYFFIFENWVAFVLIFCLVYLLLRVVLAIMFYDNEEA